MFVDRAEITVKSGDGGNGAVSFRREKYVPEGGPDGGNGGNGGSIIFVVDSGMRTLMDFKYQKKYIAERGEDGKNKNAFGKKGKNLEIRVPLGTVIIDKKTQKPIKDMNDISKEYCILRGGRGGKGNTEFKSSIRRAPNFASKGYKGATRELILELKSIADVGLAGFPNVGKSTILSILTKAKPKIANYHFTTLKPNLGVVEVIKGQSFVMADIPGLIEGASDGVGLGHDFLRHIQRTRLILHVVDASASEGRNPLADFKTINSELESYDISLRDKKMIILANKMDLAEDILLVDELKDFAEAKGFELFEISAIQNKGLTEAMKRVSQVLTELPPVEEIETYDINDEILMDNKPEFNYHYSGGIYEVSGEGVDRLMYSTSFENYESMRNFDSMLRKKGIIQKLLELGLKEGDTVLIGDVEFIYYE